jgi:hypothetical protein
MTDYLKMAALNTVLRLGIDWNSKILEKSIIEINHHFEIFFRWNQKKV